VTRRATPVLAALAAACLLAVAGCGKGSGDGGEKPGEAPSAPAETRAAPPSRIEAIEAIDGSFDPRRIYEREAPGVVTVISVFSGEDLEDVPRGARGLGSGFVLDGKGEVATNAHVVTQGTGRSIKRAQAVYVQFADGNQVSARIIGFDPNSDVALLRVNPKGLTLRPLPLGSSAALVVGSPVVAIGSPFGEPQSLSVGVISATERTIESLTSFQISDAIQTDAAINRGNSGGPLVDARGRVVGINSQIQTTGGGGEGVGFAVPVDTVRRSLDQLRKSGRVRYAYIGISSVALFPQLARRLNFPVDRGAFIQEVVDGGPADKAGLRGGSKAQRFQAQRFQAGGDIVTRVGGRKISEEADLSRAIQARLPGDRIQVEYFRDGKKRTTTVTLEERPQTAPDPTEQP